MRGPRGGVPLGAVAALAVLAAALGILVRAAGVPAGGEGEAARVAEEQATAQLPEEPEMDEEAQALARELLDGAGQATRTCALDVPEASSEVLEGYAARSDCVLRQAAYLGLSGDSWGCVVLGGGWAEICLVVAADEGSEVRTWRVSQEDVEGLLCP